MSDYTFVPADFRVKFPEFTDPPYSDEMLESCWAQASCFVSDENYGCLAGGCREQALNLMTAHLCKLSNQAAAGQTSQIVTSASIDKVSVGLTAPPFTDQWSWWLNTTPYGMQLQALLSSVLAGGLYIGGRAEKSAFRKVGGYF